MKLFIKIFSVAVLGFILTATVSIAASKYVVEEFEITMRTGPDQANKIIALIPSGNQVEIITPGDTWTEVRLANGKQGWVLSRYLTDELPSEIKLARLEKEHARLLSAKNDLEQKAGELERTNAQLNKDLTQTRNQLAELTATYDALKTGSADYVNLKQKHDTTLKDFEALRSHSQKVENELNRLANNHVYQGMLYGGILIAVGFIVGFIVKKPKRRSGLI